MITITYGIFQDRDFRTALEKLETHGKFPVKVAYNISKIIQRLQSLEKKVQDEYITTAKKFAKLDEKGNFIPLKRKVKTKQKDDKGVETEVETEVAMPNTFDTTHCQEEWNKAVEAFTKTEIQIDRPKLDIADFDNVGLTPNDVLALEPIAELPTLADAKMPECNVHSLPNVK